MPNRFVLAEAIRTHSTPYVQYPDMMDVDIVFSTSAETDAVEVMVALDGGLMGYGSGSVVDQNEVPC